MGFMRTWLSHAWPFGSAKQRLRDLLRDEQGDEGVNKILIIAMVAIPLIIILIFFGGEIIAFFKNAWADLTGKQMDTGNKF